MSNTEILTLLQTANACYDLIPKLSTNYTDQTLLKNLAQASLDKIRHLTIKHKCQDKNKFHFANVDKFRLPGHQPSFDQIIGCQNNDTHDIYFAILMDCDDHLYLAKIKDGQRQSTSTTDQIWKDIYDKIEYRCRNGWTRLSELTILNILKTDGNHIDLDF